ncbi:MAG TPA: UDP-glucuronic acid decarboxylase family protein [Candidatus Acidoferrales bacterium]|nr:UDP-glucuronic acid decarboxylase family protein [Candidatus Acidoferrales bacterium]
MRAVVTGGAGFIGSHLCDLLTENDWEVVCIDNLVTGAEANVAHLQSHPQFRLVLHDVTQAIPVDGSVDAVLHCACPASPVDYMRLPIETLTVGSVGTQNALEFALVKKAKFLLTSTSECYGDPEVTPQPESYWGHVNPIGPRSVYDEAKRFSEALTMAYHRTRGLDSRIARIFNTYGPRMRLNDGRVLPNFVHQALTGQPLTVYGDGSQTRSFCYVSDLVDGLYRLLRAEFHEPVNLGNPVEMTILDFAKMVLQYTGAQVGIAYRPLPIDDPKRRCPDISRARQLLGWEPQVKLEEGLQRTIDSLRRAGASAQHR